MLAERSPDEQSDVGPTLASNVGPTELTTLSQRWPNVVMLSGILLPDLCPCICKLVPIDNCMLFGISVSSVLFGNSMDPTMYTYSNPSLISWISDIYQ